MNNLEYKKESFFEKKPELVGEAFDYAENYKKFLNEAKTEREAVQWGIDYLQRNGFRPYKWGMELVPGDKCYYVNRGKNLFAFVMGKEKLEKGIRITAAHIDSPRLDLKQVPLYESEGFGYLKTHYYGGIRKYQWLTVPLALHGVIVKQNGEKVNLAIGENENDPIFYISDLLPHLAHSKEQKPLDSAVDAEKLNVIFGTMPLTEEEKHKIKANLLTLLNKNYGIIEEDFLSAELTMVPALKARDVGLDRSLIAGYGHDDRCCAYPAMTALVEEQAQGQEHTTMCIWVDKEETGSDGVTGMQSDLIVDLLDEIALSQNANPRIVRSRSKCFSSDVTANLDPDHMDVFEKNNSALINCGIGVCKFTGARGKSGTSDASAEMVAFTRKCLNQAGVCWQLTELGKVDVGGGGTVAKYMANHNIDTIDIGVGVTSMHAPYELIAKTDLFEGYRAFRAFYGFNDV